MDISEGLRLGDLACMHAYLSVWRHAHPHDKLTVVYNKFNERSIFTQDVPQMWLFGEIVDELWEFEVEGETLHKPDGNSMGDIYRVFHIWEWWAKLRRNPNGWTPNIKVPAEYMTIADTLLNEKKVPKNFVVIQPLFDAQYNTFRNAPIEWWDALIACVSERAPVVILKDPKSLAQLKPGNYFTLPAANENVMNSLAVTARATVMVGGDTGLPKWASMFQVPVVNTVRQWETKHPYDFRPIPFGARVLGALLDQKPSDVSARICTLFEKQKISKAGSAPCPL